MKSIINIIQKIPTLKSKQKIITQLNLLEPLIELIIKKIGECNTPESANNYYDCLQKAHCLISDLIYNKNLEVSDLLWKFCKDFERVDDQRLRNYLFDQIKNGTYSLREDEVI